MLIFNFLSPYIIEIIITFLFIVGIIGHIFIPSLMILLTPYFILTIGVIIMFLDFKKNHKLLITMGLIGFISFFLEVVGVKSGLIFGVYSYGKTLGIKLLEVPIIIAFNWVLVIIGAYLWSEFLFLKIKSKISYLPFSIFIILFTGLLSMILDFFIEPIAITHDYWTWQNVSVPIENYIAWFLIGSLGGFIAYQFKLKVHFHFLKLYYILQLFFFVSLNLLLT